MCHIDAADPMPPVCYPNVIIYFRCFLVMSSPLAMMTSSNGNIFRVTGPLCGEFTSTASVTSNHGPHTILLPVRFLARKAEWSARRNFMSVLFPWSHQATGPVRLDTSAYLWPVRASYGPRSGIFFFFISYGTRTGPCVTRKSAVRRPYGHVRELTQP